MKKILLVISILFLFSGKVYAACSGEEKIELNQKAANIKVNYEVLTEEESLYDGSLIKKKIQVNIYNVSEEFYVVVTNKETKEEMTFTSADAVDGVISFRSDDLSKVLNYTFEVKALMETTNNCAGVRFKVLYLTTPRFNEYYLREICDNNEDFAYCKEFVTVKEISEEEFVSKITKYLEKEETENQVNDEVNDNVIINFIVKYKWFIIISLIVIAMGSTIAILNNKKRQRELGI